MSSMVQVNMVLIASKNLLPINQMEKCFKDCLSETNCEIVNGNLVMNNITLGKLLLGERIVVKTYNSEKSILDQTKELRNLFSRRSEILYQNYQNDLEDKMIKAKQSLEHSNELKKFIDTISKQKEKSIVALQRQQKENCIALKEELIEEAQNQGYDVIDNSSNEIKLQFIKRSY